MQTDSSGQFPLPPIKGEENIRLEAHGNRDVKDI
jgi:hypothetical protein